MKKRRLSERRINPILSSLWLCAGAIPSVLKEWPTEWSKYTSIGISVLTTALLAAISAGYVIYSASTSFWLAFIVAVVWSLLILNLNRFIVSSLTVSSSMGESRITVRTEQLLRALPRFILALFIALVISTPLQMVIFQREIQEYIYQQHSPALDDTKQQIAVTEREIANLNESLKFESQRLTNVSEAYLAEIAGTGLTGRPGYGAVARSRLEELRRTAEEVKASKAQLETELIQKTSTLAALKSQEDDLTRTLQSSQSSFLARYKTLSSLAMVDLRIRLAGFFISVLIMLLEVSPMLFKLLLPRGPYDEALSRITGSFTDKLSQPATQLDFKLRKELDDALDNTFLKHRQEKLKP